MEAGPSSSDNTNLTQAFISSNDAIYEQFANYPFEQDTTFMQGLESILSSNVQKSDEELETIIERAKTFYFSRITGNAIDYSDYICYKASLNSDHNLSTAESAAISVPANELMPTPTAQSQDDQQQYPSMAEVARLLQEGREDLIPNNEKIPEGINDSVPSESHIQVKKKPWEVNAIVGATSEVDTEEVLASAPD